MYPRTALSVIAYPLFRTLYVYMIAYGGHYVLSDLSPTRARSIAAA
jgi:hypothetical protein